MPVNYPNLDITIPDEGDTDWYDDLLDWFDKIDQFAGDTTDDLADVQAQVTAQTEVFGIVFNGAGEVVLTGGGTIVTKTY